MYGIFDRGSKTFVKVGDTDEWYIKISERGICRYVVYSTGVMKKFLKAVDTGIW